MPVPATESEPNASPRTSPPWLSLAGILLLALVLRLPGFTESVWFDELFTSRLFCGDVITLLRTLGTDIHPPLYFLFMHLWIGAFGDGEVALRVPPLLCGLASVALLYRVGAWLGGRWLGLVAALLLALSPVHIWYSQEARPSAAIVLMVLVTVDAFLRLVPAPRGSRWWRPYAFGLTCIAFLHYYLVTFLLALPVLAWLRRSANLRRIVAIHAVVLLVFGGYIGAKMFLSSVPTGSSHLRAFDLGEAWSLLFTWFPTGNAFTPRDIDAPVGFYLLCMVQGAVLVLLAWGSAALCTRLRPRGGPDVLLMALLLPAFLFALPLIGLTNTYVERSAIPSLPLYLLVVAAGLTSARTEAGGRLAAAMSAALGLSILVAFAIHRDHWTVYRPNPDWRAATAYLADELRDGVEPLYTEFPVPMCLTYYDPRFVEVKYFDGNADKVARLRDHSARLFGTEGFPGAAIRSWIDGVLGELEAAVEARQRNMRLGIYYLPRHDPLDEGGPEEFWLVQRAHWEDAATRALLADPRVTVVSEAAFDHLRVLRLARTP